jgi:hypothetical protein
VDLAQLIKDNFKEITYGDVKKDMYFISPNGQIFSKYINKLMISRLDKDGYLEIGLRTTKNKQRYFKIHQLVALTYIGNPSSSIKDPTVDHIDANILNNHYTNLRWIERSINSSIRKNKGVGESNHQAILKEDDVIQICELLVANQYSLRQIGNMFNVSKSTISNIKRNKNWKHITTNYNFV